MRSPPWSAIPWGFEIYERCRIKYAAARTAYRDPEPDDGVRHVCDPEPFKLHDQQGRYFYYYGRQRVREEHAASPYCRASGTGGRSRSLFRRKPLGCRAGTARRNPAQDRGYLPERRVVE